MHILETIEHKNHKIQIILDEYPSSPADSGAEDLFLVATEWLRDTNVEGFYADVSMIDEDNTYQNYFAFHVTHDGSLRRLGNLRLHDGIDEECLDRQHVGIIYANMTFWNRSEALQAANNLLEDWQQYLDGNVKAFVICDELGEEIDACYGFYGDSDYIIDEAKSVIDSLVARENKLKEQLKIVDSGHGYVTINHKDMLLCFYDDGSIGLDVSYSNDKVTDNVIDAKIWEQIQKEVAIWTMQQQK